VFALCVEKCLESTYFSENGNANFESLRQVARVVTAATRAACARSGGDVTSWFPGLQLRVVVPLRVEVAPLGLVHQLLAVLRLVLLVAPGLGVRRPGGLLGIGARTEHAHAHTHTKHTQPMIQQIYLLFSKKTTTKKVKNPQQHLNESLFFFFFCEE